MYRLETKALESQMTQRTTEYLLTNGLGGYSSSTVTGLHTRKYHGVLVAAMSPPVERYMTLSKLYDSVVVGNTRYILDHNQFDDCTEATAFCKGRRTENVEKCEIVCPETFERHYGVQWTYTFDRVVVKKTLAMMPGHNQVAIRYEIQSKQAVLLDIQPWFSLRDHHDVQMEDPVYRFKILDHQKLSVTHAKAPISVNLWPQCSNDAKMAFVEKSGWAPVLFLANEHERGLQESEHCWYPGHYHLTCDAGETRLEMTVGASHEQDMDGISAASIFEAAQTHYEALRRASGTHTTLCTDKIKALHAKLAVAADQFIVKRASTGKATIMAGYPWFADWGRDTMISLTGLTFHAGRPEVFREIVETFLSYMKEGILPNMFPDHGEEPLYNTVDATLWLPVSIHRYYQATNDLDWICNKVMPSLIDMLHYYQKGTLNNTYMDEDGLIYSGNPTTQLTWMDVKVQGWVVTPRHGKAVEINALWYNAIEIVRELIALIDQQKPEAQASLREQLRKASLSQESLEALGGKVKMAFRETFWGDGSRGWLADCVRGGEVIEVIRPNQLFALSLPHPLMTPREAAQILAACERTLVTPKGLRSLEPSDAEYQSIYIGNVLKRDGAYHRGTVWGWLMGPYLDALLAVKGYRLETALEAYQAIEQFCRHLDDTCIGQLSEIFDGEAPHTPRGCMAQAWSVAEILRILDSILPLIGGTHENHMA